MNLTLIQTSLHWEDSNANSQMMDAAIAKLAPTDLIVLPEMWNTGFSNKSKNLSQSMDGPALRQMHAWARSADAAVVGSVMIKEKDAYYNRMLWVGADGKIEHYDKRHLFRMAGEHEHFSSGNQRTIVNFKGWRIMLQVCYDLRFPVFARNTYHEGSYDYDLILYVANWPSPRHQVWETLLRARAMENLAYCVGVNRVGNDANGISYKGGSAVLDYMGKTLVEAGESVKSISTEINLASLRAFRDHFPTGLDADSFTLKR